MYCAIETIKYTSTHITYLVMVLLVSNVLFYQVPVQLCKEKHVIVDQLKDDWINCTVITCRPYVTSMCLPIGQDRNNVK